MWLYLKLSRVTCLQLLRSFSNLCDSLSTDGGLMGALPYLSGQEPRGKFLPPPTARRHLSLSYVHYIGLCSNVH